MIDCNQLCPGGGIGRRSRLKIYRRKSCGFDPQPRVPVGFRHDRLRSEAVSGNEGRAGETQVAGMSRGNAGAAGPVLLKSKRNVLRAGGVFTQSCQSSEG